MRGRGISDVKPEMVCWFLYILLALNIGFFLSIIFRVPLGSHSPTSPAPEKDQKF
jgi:hypothetical protein